MSHNKFTVANQAPDSNGNVSLALNNLDDVNISTPQDNQVVLFKSASSDYRNETFSLGNGLLVLGQGDSNAYSNSGASSMSGAVYLYAPSASTVNTIGATINKYLSTDWVTSVTLPAGKYFAQISYRVKFSTTGYFNFGLVDASSTSTERTSKAYIGEERTTQDNAASIAFGYFELTTSTELIIHSNDASGVDSVANQSNIPSEFSTLLIREVS